MPPARSHLLVLALPALIAGCGESRTPIPNSRVPASPLGALRARYPGQGISFARPLNWNLDPGQAPRVATVSSSRAEVTLWRYPRRQPLPTGAAGLEAARAALVVAARRRDRTLVVKTSAVGRVAGGDALVLIGRETVGTERRAVLSVHIFRYGAEVVFDALGPFARFAALERSVFGPMLGSLHIRPVHHRRRQPIINLTAITGQ